MLLTLSNLTTKLSLATDDERQWLRDYLSFENDQAKYIKGLRGDGKIRVFNQFAHTFPTGFVPLVETAAIREGFKVEKIDVRRQPATGRDLDADLSWLRWYQKETLEACFTQTRGIIWISTGGGKGSIIAGLTQALPCKTLFLVHRNSLVVQQAERIADQAHVECGRVGEGRWEGFSDKHRVVCASFQTLAKRFSKPETQQLLNEAECLVIDEVHTLPADSYLRIAQSTPNAYWRFGFSGTPLARGDRRSVLAIGALGKVIYRVKTDVLVEEGVLAKPKIKIIPIHQYSNKVTWNGVQKELITRSKIRNEAVVSATLAVEKPAMIFIREIEHGRTLTQMLEQAGLRTTFIHGEHSTEWRTSHNKRLLQGHFDVMVASVVYQEGTDLPALRSVVIACGGASIIAALQRIGRGMRIADGKTTFEVVDFKDTGQHWMAKHSQKRIKAYVSEGHEVIEETAFFQKKVQ